MPYRATAGLSVAAGLSTVGWSVYFLHMAIRTGRVLKGQPFMLTRRQQLAYRVMLSQVRT
jgi:hypothetical protein